MNYIQLRSGQYHFRYRIPSALIPFLGKQEIKASLHTGNRLEALLKSHSYLKLVGSLKQISQRLSTSRIPQQDIQNLIQASLKDCGEYNTLFGLDTPKSPIAPIAPVTTITLKSAIDKYCQIKIGKREWTEQTEQRVKSIYSELLEITGDRPLGEVSKEAIEQYTITLSSIPKNRDKFYPTQAIKDFQDMEFDESQLPSSRTIKEKLSIVSSFFRWCVAKEYIAKNPCDNITIKSQSLSYAPFDKADLKKLFSDDVKQIQDEDWKYWLPLLALYTGARQTELAQLLVKDVIKIDNIWCFSISEDGDDQRVKTQAGIRLVPIHNKLIELGFLDYYASLQNNQEDRLWPSLKKGGNGWGHNVARWYRDKLKPFCGIKNHPSGARKVWHSFRHTFITAAMSQGLPITHIQQMVGHEKSLGETSTYTHLDIGTLKDTIDKIDMNTDVVQRCA